MRERFVAILIAFFAGGFGIHQFYLGNRVKGIWYLIFFWTFIPTIAAFIDMLILLFMTDRDFDLRYNYEYLANAQHYEDEMSFSMHDTREQREFMNEHFVSNDRNDVDFQRDPSTMKREFDSQSFNVDDFLDLKPLDKGLDLDKLERLGKLRELGVLSQEEFEEQKQILLNR